ncbi:MAG: T9SS type A sorting domain-containing protein [Candidatus Coatesbacteria bacterium]|nr:MAG: T9SS type A sorting domain-containing protein [Candidatus Coatesbacteria bacterium]
MKIISATTGVVCLLVAGVIGAADAKYGGAAPSVDGETNSIHDAGLYWLKLHYQFYVGDRQGGGGSYPGQNGVPTVYIGSVWVGTDAWGTPRVSGDFPYVANEWYRLQGLLWSDGSSWNQRPPHIEKRSALDSYLRVDDRDAKENGPIGLVAEQHGMQWSNARDDDYVIFQYRFLNNSGRDLSDEFVCLFYDFDVGGSLSYIDDYVGVDLNRKMPYMYDDEQDHPYVGLRVLDGKPHTGCTADILNDPDTDAKKWAMMTSGKWESQSEKDDWRVGLSSGPHVCRNGDKLRVAFAVVAGRNLAHLRTNADAAYNKYWEIFTGVDTFWGRAVRGAVELNWKPNATYAGFNLYRTAATEPGAEIKVNDRLITGRAPFRFLDAAVEEAVTYRYELETVGLSGGRERYGPVEVKAGGSAPRKSFVLASTYPNPAHERTTIAFSLPEAGNIALEVYDLSGRKVATVAEGYYEPGPHEVQFDTGKLTAGVYLYTLTTATERATRKLAVTR